MSSWENLGVIARLTVGHSPKAFAAEFNSLSGVSGCKVFRHYPSGELMEIASSGSEVHCDELLASMVDKSLVAELLETSNASFLEVEGRLFCFLRVSGSKASGLIVMLVDSFNSLSQLELETIRSCGAGFLSKLEQRMLAAI